jgi:hypothetical protein
MEQLEERLGNSRLVSIPDCRSGVRVEPHGQVSPERGRQARVRGNRWHLLARLDAGDH